MTGEHTVQVYYEDTDFSGLVYHANYLKFFERAREHMLGRERLVELWDVQGVGFVVYRASMNFREGAKFGDVLRIRTTVTLQSAYRACFHQSAWRDGGERPLVEAEIDLVCVDRSERLVALPDAVRSLIAEPDSGS